MAISNEQKQFASARPTQAVILAGGRGERLRPLTDTRPKPMLEIHGKPFLEYQIEQLREQGLSRVLLLLGYLPEVVQDYFGDGERWGVQIEYSVTAVENNTGRRLKLAEQQLEECFLLLYCDNYWPMSMDRMWSRYLAAGAPAMLTVYGNRDDYTKNTLRLDDAGFVAVYDKQRQASNLKGTEISYGIFRKELLRRMPEGNVSFEETLYPELARDHELAAYLTHHRYYSVGSMARLAMTEAFLARRPAILLDRDGVVNRRPPKGEYVRNSQEFSWLPGALEALRLLKHAGYRVMVISNQAGVARGAMTEADVLEISRRMVREAAQAGGGIDAVYYCPHHWEENCECRKPKPGMLFQAQRDFNLDLSRTLFIGDDDRDAQAADGAECCFRMASEQKSLLEIVRELIPGTVKP